MAQVHHSKTHKIWILHLVLERRNSVKKTFKLKGFFSFFLYKTKAIELVFLNVFHVTAQKTNGSFLKAPSVTSSSKEMICQHTHNHSGHISMSPHPGGEVLVWRIVKVPSAHDICNRKMVKLEWERGKIFQAR